MMTCDNFHQIPPKAMIHYLNPNRKLKLKLIVYLLH